ncbi:MAG: hypothetical protein AAGI72_23440 [Pseudomonadota bacterium]
MAYTRFDRWVQMSGALGIVAGLLLVGLELKQSALLVRAELGSGSMTYRQNLLSSVRGEDLASALAQAIDDPAVVSLQQQVILDAWYDDVLGQVLRQRYLLGLDVFKDPLEPFARTQARVYFGNPYAQAWWRRNRSGYPEAIVSVMDPVIDGIDPQRDLREFEALRADAALLRSSSTTPPEAR